MIDNDFTACEFIDECLRFLTYDDFCKHRKIIKLLYSALDNTGKRFYKWYVYANIHIDEVKKGIIWEYLNYDDPCFTERLLKYSKYNRQV
jgi:hypothetical protein